MPVRTVSSAFAGAAPGFGPPQMGGPHSGQSRPITMRPLSAVRRNGRGPTPVMQKASAAATRPSLPTLRFAYSDKKAGWGIGAKMVGGSF